MTKLFVIVFVLALLFFSPNALAASFSFAVSSSLGHASFSPTLPLNPLNIKNRTLSSPNAQFEGYFGWSVSMSGNLVTVGAQGETVDGYLAGAGHAYIFNSATGKLIFSLTSPNPIYDGDFGYSVYMSGKLVAIGAPGETVDGDLFAGHAYIFNAVTGKLVTALTSPNVQSFGDFGFSVSMNGKLVTVGAVDETADGYSDAGHAYVFNANTGKLIQTLTSPNAQSYGWFGYSVSMSGKLVTVGAQEETADGYAGAGHAYIFNVVTGKLIQTLTSPKAQSDGLFGTSVSASGALVTVGAEAEIVDGYTYAGHTYVFNAISGKLVQTLTSPNAQSDGFFGQSVSMTAKLVVVGAPDETADGYSYAGHAYEFNANTGKLVQTLSSPNAQEGGAFGWSVFMSGKLVTVGAPYEPTTSAEGYAYIFYNI